MRPFSAILLLSLTAAAWGGEAPPAPLHYTASDTIVILGAVPQEITVFTEAMGNPPRSELWGVPAAPRVRIRRLSIP